MMRRLALVAFLLWAGGAAAQGTTEPAFRNAAPPAPATRGEPITVDRQANHPNGTTPVVNSLLPRRTSIVVDVTVTTGPEQSELNDYGMALVDDQGSRCPVVPLEGNTNIPYQRIRP